MVGKNQCFENADLFQTAKLKNKAKKKKKCNAKRLNAAVNSAAMLRDV